MVNTGVPLPACRYWPGPTCRSTTTPAMGAVDRGDRIDVLRPLQRVDFAQATCPRMLRRLRTAIERGLGCREVGLRLLPVLQAAALGVVQGVLAGFADARDLDLRGRGAQVVLRLYEL